MELTSGYCLGFLPLHSSNLFSLCYRLLVTTEQCFLLLLGTSASAQKNIISGRKTKNLVIEMYNFRLYCLPLTAFLLCISGDGDGDGRQSICDDVELIFFRFCSSEASISLVMGKPEIGCLYLAHCRASMIHLISRQTSSICFEIKW